MALLISFGASLFIEVFQLFTLMGSYQSEDLIVNTLGGIIGYLIYKLTQNCYKNELIQAPEKCPHQKNAIYTLKKVKEIFPYMEEREYDTGL